MGGCAPPTATAKPLPHLGRIRTHAHVACGASRTSSPVTQIDRSVTWACQCIAKKWCAPQQAPCHHATRPKWTLCRTPRNPVCVSLPNGFAVAPRTCPPVSNVLCECTTVKIVHIAKKEPHEGPDAGSFVTACLLVSRSERLRHMFFLLCTSMRPLPRLLGHWGGLDPNEAKVSL